MRPLHLIAPALLVLAAGCTSDLVFGLDGGLRWEKRAPTVKYRFTTEQQKALGARLKSAPITARVTSATIVRDDGHDGLIRLGSRSQAFLKTSRNTTFQSSRLIAIGFQSSAILPGAIKASCELPDVTANGDSPTASVTEG